MLYDEELEKAILCFIIYENYSCDLNENDFYTDRGKKTIKAINQLKAEKKEVNIIEIRDKIKAKNSVDVLEYLTTLGDTLYKYSDADTVYEKLIEFTKRRQLMDLLSNTLTNFDEITTEELITKIQSIQNRNSHQVNFIDQVSNTIEEIENNWKKRNDFSLYTGIRDLDNKTCGLHKQELTIIGARPGVGKTTLALQMAQHIAQKGLNIVFVSLEMSDTQIIQKIIARETKINSYKMRMGTLEESDFDEIAKVSGEIAELPIQLITNATTIQKIEMVARRLKSKNKLDVLIIDYLQLIRNANKFNSREQEVADITRTLKLLSLELNIPIIGLCQLNRNANNREPSLADLRESGAIEQDADNVIFLYQEQESEEIIVDVTLKLAKQRAGETGRVYLKFNKPRSEFVGVMR